MIKVKVNLKSSPMPIRTPNVTPSTTQPGGLASEPADERTGWLSVGELAERAGVAPSALRYYEARGLISGARSAGGQRRYPRAVLRRVAFILAAQRVGLSLESIQAALATLPQGRTPTRADWQRLSAAWQPLLAARIRELQALQGQLASCIGCGCLSLKTCALYNPEDRAGRRGPGARYLLGDKPSGMRG